MQRVRTDPNCQLLTGEISESSNREAGADNTDLHTAFITHTGADMEELKDDQESTEIEEVIHLSKVE